MNQFITFIRILKKVYWKMRWKIIKHPMVIKKWHQGIKISIPYSGSAAQIYYRKYSEPQIALWLQNNLHNGDCFVDVGAHVGEYSLLAAAAIGTDGTIIALEPQRDLCNILLKNFSDNNLNNAHVIHGALGEHNGRCHLLTDTKTKGAVLDTKSSEADVPMYDLPTLLKDVPDNIKIWLKLDAAGYELPCLNACRNYLKSRAVNIVIKAYSQREISNRFPGVPTSLGGLLHEMDYKCFIINNGNKEIWDGKVGGYCETVVCLPSNSTSQI
jgi:FkbM family methyltransferase